MMESVSDLLGEDFSSKKTEELESNNDIHPELLDLNWPETSDFLGGDFMPSKLIQGDIDFNNLVSNKEIPSTNKMMETKEIKGDSKKSRSDNSGAQMTWLSLFAELDPLANQDNSLNGTGDRA